MADYPNVLDRNASAEVQRARKTKTFAATAGNGAQGTVTIFTVTGTVFVERIVPRCTTDLTSGGAATVALGVAADTDAFCGQITATNWDAGEIWTAATGLVTGASTLSFGASSDNTTSVVNKVVNTDIIITVAGADLSGGVAVFDVWYRPISDDGRLVGD